MEDLLNYKIENEKDPIRKIIKSYVKDVTLGNGRDNLNYVDALYPAVELIFGADTCINALENNEVLKKYYDTNFSADISYDNVCRIFSSYINLIEHMKNDEDILMVCNEAIKAFDNLDKTKKSKKM